MDTLNLLSEFPPVSTETWEQTIREDLKDADYAEKLIWHSPEGIDVKPYYRAEDLAGLGFLDAAPGDFPFVRGTRSTGGWLIREVIHAIDPEEANAGARCAVAAGAEEIAFCRATLANAWDVGVLLSNLGEIRVHFENVDDAAIRLLIERLNKRQHAVALSAGLNWSTNVDWSADVLAKAPLSFAPFTIHAEHFQDSGATAVEEAGFALASAVDFVAAMQERGFDADRVADSVNFSFAMGPEIFMQIAKLRAFRMVWAQAMESFGGTREHAKARIHARTSRWNRTVYDPHVNMLRGTTEAMSAVLGGADSIYVAPFDECYREPDEASRRLALNTQIILKHEALLSRVADPAGGSYYLEVLTDSIARKAWKLLQDIEAAGGFRKASEAGMIARKLEQRVTAQEKAVTSRRRVLTGTNRFANASERACDQLDMTRMSGSRRAAQTLERMRLRTERDAIETGKALRVLLAEIGDAKMRSARSQFAADFFACAGFDTQVQRFENTQEIAKSEADVIVLCSSDAEYLALAAELLPRLKARRVTPPVLVAGNPETAEKLRAAGVADFVHVRSNVIELLTRLQVRLGINE